ncbi:glycoside hydrolase family 13 protein [Sediminitomix flava]|uniref:Glycosidase n=1 Tax=Sediminitomix flava TaxID=379075 RepID=A0A315ZZA8_SEDFL|nr:glycoside hydrolase family 13 protein [Sediminitomix flava]PWJ42697.1 glycosidase [Sediminitomix flava]
MRSLNKIILIPLLALTFLMSNTANAQDIIDRIEPTFWWVGMHNPNLQLMIHGDKIGDLNPSVSYKGVTLEQVIKVENPNYLFINLNISPEAKAGSFPIEFKIDGKLVFTYKYELKQRRKGSAEREGFCNKDIIYLITPDRFANGDPSNDTVKGMREAADRSDKNGRHGGDIKGIIDHLDYIKDMGFTAIWVNPLLENDMEKYSYHGYATTDYYKIDPRFGTNNDYLRLTEEANKKGIKIIMDMIENHNGLFHWWTGDEPTNDWYHYQSEEKKTFTSHKKFTIPDPYATNTDKEAYSDGWFDTIMPDLNQRNPLMANYLIQNSIWWVEYANLGGIRQDTYTYPDPDFMAEWSCRIMAEYPNFNIVGEEWIDQPAIVSRWQKGKINENGYESCLPSLIDFPLQKALETALNLEKKPYSDTFNSLYETLAYDFLYPDPYNLVTMIDNHDIARFYNQVNENLDLFKMGLIYLYVTRGIPQIYYGTEILINNTEIPDDHSLIRTDMPGGWKSDSVNVFTEKGLTKEQKEVKDLVKKLNHFRTDNPALQTGQLKHYVPRDEVYVLFRFDEKKKIMSIFNKNKDLTSVELSHYQELLEGATKAINALTNESYDLKKGTINVEGTSATILIIE